MMKRYLLSILIILVLAPVALFAQEKQSAKAQIIQILDNLSPAQQAKLLDAAKTIQKESASIQDVSMDQSTDKNASISLSGNSSSVQVAQEVPNVQRPDYIVEAEAMEATTVEWDQELHDFGKIIQGTKAKHTFKFTNTGEHPLKITRVKPSCGCTSPSYSKEEIGPGEEGFVEVVFNSAGRKGTQNKAVTVTMNTEEKNKVLRFKGEVVENDDTQ